MNVIVRLIILIVSVYVASYLLPGIVINSFGSLLVVAIILGIVNTFIKPILIILTLPLTIITLGIFLLLLNGVLVLLVDILVPGFSVASLFSAILFSIVVSLVSWSLQKIS